MNEAPTKKQLDIIQKIEDRWVYRDIFFDYSWFRFTGKTKKEAHDYISRNRILINKKSSDEYLAECEREIKWRREYKGVGDIKFPITPGKNCSSCAHFVWPVGTEYQYCLLKHPRATICDFDVACDKWSCVKERVLYIKCRICEKEGMIIGKNTLPNGWCTLLSPDNYYCPECGNGMSNFIDREIVRRKPDNIIRTIKSTESFWRDCF